MTLERYLSTTITDAPTARAARTAERLVDRAVRLLGLQQPPDLRADRWEALIERLASGVTDEEIVELGLNGLAPAHVDRAEPAELATAAEE